MNREQFLVKANGQWFLQEDDGTYALDDISLDQLLHEVPAEAITEVLARARSESLNGEIQPAPPVEHQEVWASGVTYKRSEEARERESKKSTIYTYIYNAERPELFFKAWGPDVVGVGDEVGIRYDAAWSVPEPELTIVLNAHGDVFGFTIGNDMSSRDIEGENPMYLPQAKVYDNSCAIGPRIWLQPGATVWPDVDIRMVIERAGSVVYDESTATNELHRTLDDLVSYLFRCKSFRTGIFLLTGAGLVPPDEFTLAVGDRIRISIDPIGELVNTVIQVGGKS